MGIVKIYNVLAVLFGEGISLIMGCSKKYIMYWGVFTLIIVSRVMKNVYYRDAQTCINSRLFFMQYVYH